MGSATGPQKGSNCDEIFMQHSLQFAESLKDLRVLKEQLYSAAEYFESSYDKDDHQILVMESSKDYLAKAVVNTVDHLGSVADKINKFLDEKANEFKATNTRFSCIEQKLETFKGFVDMRGVSQHSLIMEAPNHNKHSILPDPLQIGKPKLIYKNCIIRTKQDNPFTKAFQAKPQPPLSRKGYSKPPPSQHSGNFTFMRAMSKKETGKRSVSPLRFPFKRSGSVGNTSSDTRQPSLSMHIVAEMRNREGQMVESYAKRSKHLFKALLSAHRSRKENQTI